MFSTLDFLGWYTTGEAPTDQEIKVHKQICLINECPIMLQLNPQPRTTDVRSNFQPSYENALFIEFAINLQNTRNCRSRCTSH